MRTTKTITITGQEILEYYMSITEDCTTNQARRLLENAEVFIDIKETGDFDRSDYKRELKEIRISYEK